jgi:polyhydroxyalkanoate synthesis regulator phasin
MDLKNSIIDILFSKGYSYTDLCIHLQMNESELDAALEEGKLNIQTIEKISKDLQIPLYSFFRTPAELLSQKKPWLTSHLWESEYEKLTARVKELEHQVEQLTEELKRKADRKIK